MHTPISILNKTPAQQHIQINYTHQVSYSTQVLKRTKKSGSGPSILVVS